ncbi:MAG TPA: methanol dehydrogenase [Cryomorphaceae bacterium]|nr:methanol dehydrogenase [Cryomorphaceae bacterium]
MRRLTSLFLLLFLSLNLAGQRFPEKPSPPRLVNDLATVLTRNDAARLERKLVAYDDSTSTQITVITVKDIGGDDINLYAAELGEKWGIGQKGKDNGVLILLAQKEREITIQVGYGLEPVLTDAISKRIIENYIIPEFKQGDFYGGLDSGTDQIIKALAGEFKNENPRDSERGKGIPWFPIIIMIIIFIAIAAKGNRGGRGGRGGGGYWIGGFGGGSFGGGGGGGFGGFGGGSFGGGGASGYW